MSDSALCRFSIKQNGLVIKKPPAILMSGEPELQQFSDVDAAVASLRPAIPMHCLRPQELDRNAAMFLEKFPGHAYYAVKVNPDPYVLRRLYAAGITRFDVASLSEISLTRGLFPHAHLAFMHPVKSRETIRAAYFDYNVRAFVIDSFDELCKIREETDNARDLCLIVRLAMPKGSAYHPLTGKFGAEHDLAVALLRNVASLTSQVGISFHVGSQTMDPVSYVHGIRKAGEALRESGVKPCVFDVGGGFPIVGLNMAIPPLDDYFDAIRHEIAALDLPPSCEIWSEPGAALSGTSSTLVVRVELRKGDVLYLNDGAYGNLSDLCWNKRCNEVRLIRAARNRDLAPCDTLGSFRFYGPTCDSVDSMPGPFGLPENIAEGDWIAVSSLGAYGQTFRSGYNGFDKNLRVEITR